MIARREAMEGAVDRARWREGRGKSASSLYNTCGVKYNPTISRKRIIFVHPLPYFNVYCANNNDCNLLTCESKNLGMSSILIFIVSYAPSGLAESASRCILAKTLHIG